MKVDDMLKQLYLLRERMGNVDVMVTDGYQARCYDGEYEIKEFEGRIDIGIGGTEQTENSD